MRSRMLRLPLFAAVCLVLAFSSPARAATRSDVANRLEDFRQFFVDFQLAPDSAIPGDLLSECYGIIIMRQYKAGFVLGVKGGDGVIFLHDRATGAWSAPAFIASAEGSFGFQIGGQAIDAIMLIMNQDGVDMLLRSRFQIGVDASAAAGPVGRNASAKVGPGTAILAYSRAKGLYAGVAFEGGAFLNHDDFNRALYGMDVGVRDILMGGVVAVPPEAFPIIEAIQSYAISNTVEPTPITVQGATTVNRQMPPNTLTGSAPMAQPGFGEPILSQPPLPDRPPAEPQIDPNQAALDAAAADAARAAAAAQEAAIAAQQAADAAAARAAAGR